jgi:AcrR family transcriptional regulator
MNLREQIINTTIDLFNEKGYKFRLDDIAEQLYISKKTIYTQFRDKENLFLEMIRYCGSEAASMQRKILENKQESHAEKVRQLLMVWPEYYRRLCEQKVWALKAENPQIARKLKEYYDGEWELIEDTLKEAMIRGEVINVPSQLLRTMLEATLERSVAEDEAMSENIRKDIIRILMNGIEIMPIN